MWWSMAGSVSVDTSLTYPAIEPDDHDKCMEFKTARQRDDIT